jgi:hypothetical protein
MAGADGDGEDAEQDAARGLAAIMMPNAPWSGPAARPRRQGTVPSVAAPVERGGIGRKAEIVEGIADEDER